MPSNWLYIDTNFPTFTGEESSEEKITTIQNYMFMLVEQLRYSLHNLDLSNMNKTAVERYETSITEPIYARIEDGEENIADLAITAAGLGVRLSNAEGNITSLTATAEGLSLQISDAEDDILQLGITADGLATQISNAQGQISSLQQTVDGFSLSASNGENSSYLYLTSNGFIVSSARITFTGMVTFWDLSASGATTINGDNIVTGTISAITMQGNEIIGGVSRNLLVGGIRFDDNGRGTEDEARYRMFIYTNSGYMDWAMKLLSAGGMSLESGDNIYIEASTNLTMRAGWNIWIEEPAITDSSGNTWQFRDDGLYKNYVKAISLDA